MNLIQAVAILVRVSRETPAGPLDRGLIAERSFRRDSLATGKPDGRYVPLIEEEQAALPVEDDLIAGLSAKHQRCVADGVSFTFFQRATLENSHSTRGQKGEQQLRDCW